MDADEIFLKAGAYRLLQLNSARGLNLDHIEKIAIYVGLDRPEPACNVHCFSTRACPQLSQITAETKWIAARKFVAVLS